MSCRQDQIGHDRRRMVRNVHAVKQALVAAGIDARVSPHDGWADEVQVEVHLVHPRPTALDVVEDMKQVRDSCRRLAEELDYAEERSGLNLAAAKLDGEIAALVKILERP